MTNYRTTSYQYDENYSRTSMTDAESNTCTYQYDDDNRLSQVAKYSVTTTFDYDEVGNRISKTLPTGAYTEYTYSSRNWLTNLENRKSDDSLISSYAYTHDDVGNRLTMTEANGDVTHYDYDDVYRLMSEEKKDDEETRIYRYQYTYDGVGNRLTENNAGTIYYTYDSNNKLTQLVLGDDTTTFGYDNNGNMTSMTLPDETVWNYGYDYEKRLTSVTDNDEYTAAYAYAADGTRLRAQESNHAYTDRYFLYDGVRPTAEGTLSGDTWTTTERYVWEGDSHFSPLVSLVYNNNKYYPLFDGLGSTRQLTDEDQDVTDTYTYEAFGNLMSSTGSTPNPYKYVGALGYYGTGSSLMHLGARYYMPELGRFTAADPATYSSPGSVRDYQYVGNMPTMKTDPSGLYYVPVNPTMTLACPEGWRKDPAWVQKCQGNLRRAYNWCDIEMGVLIAGCLAILGGMVYYSVGAGTGWAVFAFRACLGAATARWGICLAKAWNEYGTCLAYGPCSPCPGTSEPGFGDGVSV